jgi:quinol monooxygenase YgiN
MSFPIVVLAYFRAKPEHLAELRAALAELIRATRLEPGCLRYDLHVAADDPTSFVMIEQWATRAALEAHLAQPHTRTALAKVPAWLADEVRISQWTALELDQLAAARHSS